MYPTGYTGMFPGNVLPFIGLIAAWTIFWKGLALWHSARRGETIWFVALLVINTMGLLEIFYLFVIAKRTVHDLFSK
jgi:methionyl-tRNA synthetase